MKFRISRYYTRPDYHRNLDSYFMPPENLSVSMLHSTTQILEINPSLTFSPIQKKLSLLLSMLGKNFSRQHFEILFLIFPRQQTLTFHTNCH